MVGLAVGMTRFALEFAYTVPPCGSGLYIIVLKQRRLIKSFTIAFINLNLNLDFIFA
jgi:hypothetical protein